MKNILTLFATIVIISACNSPVEQSEKNTNSSSDQQENSSFNIDHKESVKAAVLSLFDGVRESNKEKISVVLASDAEFISAKESDGELIEKITTGIDFAEKAGAPHEKAWDERLSEIEVQVNDQAAVLQANYEFYLGEDFSHKGEMKVNLELTNDQWLIKRVWYTVVKE